MKLSYLLVASFATVFVRGWVAEATLGIDKDILIQNEQRLDGEDGTPHIGAASSISRKRNRALVGISLVLFTVAALALTILRKKKGEEGKDKESKDADPDQGQVSFSV